MTPLEMEFQFSLNGLKAGIPNETFLSEVTEEDDTNQVSKSYSLDNDSEISQTPLVKGMAGLKTESI